MWAAVALARRRWWRARPDERRWLARPTVSVGNLRVGGSGKTPIVSHLARLLVEMGERPAILSRGYGRLHPPDGAVVVSDGARVLAGLERAGDEPLMLARELSGVAVVVCPDRFLAGTLAERRLGATVHLLDDGFQHFALGRDADLLVVSPDDVDDRRTLPAGWLREPVEVAGDADAVAVVTAEAGVAERVGAALGVERVFRVSRREQPMRLADAGQGVPGSVVTPGSGARVVAFAGIARPARFFDALGAGGWDVAAERAFGDHHRYRRGDVAALAGLAASVGASMLVTTAKDLVRLMPLSPFPIPVAAAGVDVTLEPADRFRAWVASVLAQARRRPGGVRAQGDGMGRGGR